MDKNIYFSYMRETADKVLPVITYYAEQIKDIDPKLHEVLKFYIDKRRGKPLLKPFLLRLSYEICGGKNWEETIPVCAAFELLNISSYQANVSFDNKLGILSLQEKNSQFIASMITRELCMDILLSMLKGRGCESFKSLATLISNSNKYIYIAQHYDLNLLTIKNFNKFIDSEDLFMKTYLERCYYGTGIFNGNCSFAGALLAGATDDQSQALKNFGENYGIGLQIINDLADFVPPGIDDILNRAFQDQFSDLQNGRLTLGVYKILKIGNRNSDWILKKLEKNEKFSIEELDKVTYIFLKENFHLLIRLFASEYATKAAESLSIFADNDTKRLLAMVTSICQENKYLKCFSKIARQFSLQSA